MYSAHPVLSHTKHFTLCAILQIMCVYIYTNNLPDLSHKHVMLFVFGTRACRARFTEVNKIIKSNPIYYRIHENKKKSKQQTGEEQSQRTNFMRGIKAIEENGNQTVKLKPLHISHAVVRVLKFGSSFQLNTKLIQRPITGKFNTKKKRIHRIFEVPF